MIYVPLRPTMLPTLLWGWQCQHSLYFKGLLLLLYFSDLGKYTNTSRKRICLDPHFRSWSATEEDLPRPPLFPCSTPVLLATRLDRFFLWWDDQTFDLDDPSAGWSWLYWVASVSHCQRLLGKDVLGQALMNPLSTTQHPPRPILQLNPIWHHYLPSFGQENVCLLIYIAWIERQIQTNLKA